MNTTTDSRFGTPIIRGLGALVLLVTYCCAYFPFATVVGRSVWNTGSAELIWAPVILMGLAFAAGTYWLKPCSKSARIASWVCLVSWIVSLLCVLLLSISPRGGHPSMGIVFLVVPVRVNAVIIPLALLLFTISFVTGERAVIAVSGFLYLLAASFFFSDLRNDIPGWMDSLTSTSYFSRTAGRLDIGLKIECPNSDEMAKDPALIKKCPLTYEKMNRLENVAARVPEFRCKVLEEILDQFPSVKEFELKRRLLMVAARLQPNLVPDNTCPRDLVLFFWNVMEERDADASDVAAGFLASQLYPILSSDRYQGCTEALAKYALERQVNPPQQLEFKDGRKYLYRTFDCARELNGVTTKLLQRTETSLADQKVATRLLLFLPYLRARQTDRSEDSNRLFNERLCSNVVSCIERLRNK